MAPILVPMLGAAAAVLAVLAIVAKHNLHHHRDSRSHRNTTEIVDIGTNGTTSRASISNTTTLSYLEQARQLEPPAASLLKGGEYEHDDYWAEHDSVLKAAWDEWWHQPSTQRALPSLNTEKAVRDNPSQWNESNAMINPSLLDAVETVRRKPTIENEQTVKDLFQPIHEGGVYHISSFLTTHGIRVLRQHLDAASYYRTENNSTLADGSSNGSSNASTSVRAGIPTRRPNGMNRYGIILDPHIEGAVTYSELNDFVLHLVNDMVRPLSRMLFPELVGKEEGDDCEYYAFTIRYHPDEDMELREHSDASVYTININLNSLEDDDETKEEDSVRTEEYEGSALYFVQDKQKVNTRQDYGQDYAASSTVARKENTNERILTNITFTPGMAVLHRGIIRHGSYPISTGERHNLVIWLFGRHGYVRFGEYPPKERLTVQERWKRPEQSSTKDPTKIEL